MIVIIIYALILIVFILAIIKNENTFKQHMVVANAIHRFRLDHIKRDWLASLSVDFEDMEEYDSTFWRLWDWGYKNILPKEKYELIKDYIGKEDVK